MPCPALLVLRAAGIRRKTAWCRGDLLGGTLATEGCASFNRSAWDQETPPSHGGDGDAATYRKVGCSMQDHAVAPLHESILSW